MADSASDRENECRFQDDFNPFEITHNGKPTCVPSVSLKENVSEQSDNYLASLEAKLKRLKGKTGGKISSKEMLQSLRLSKQDAMTRFISQDSALAPMDVAERSEERSEERTIGELKRRMFPEQPLTSEEIQCLLERDCLNQEGMREDISPMPSGGSSSSGATG